jgi:N-methylhydantoinase A/acetophenone carboxylase
MNSIDIDVGGTFTDLVLNYNGKSLIRKSPTTPYDLSVCFTRVIEEGAGALGMKIDQLLPAIDMIRYSTTIALNRLIEKKGPRLGLITTEGHEDVVLIGRGAQWIDGTRVAERRNLSVQRKPDPLIPRDMIVGVKERVDSRGKVIRPLDENDVREKVRYLTSRGARGFVVALLWGFLNPANERRVKEISIRNFTSAICRWSSPARSSASSANTSEPSLPSSTPISSAPCKSSFPLCGTSSARRATPSRY